MPIGPNFANELEAANLLAVPMTWTAEGVQFSPEASPAQRAAVQAVIDAHDPDKPNIKGAIVQIEQENPITHRALREFTLMVAAMFPEQAMAEPGIQKVAEIDAQIRALREQLDE